MRNRLAAILAGFVFVASTAGSAGVDIDALCPPRPETAARFKAGGYPAAARPYREAACLAYRYMTSLPAMTVLLETGKPNQKYQHNAYVSKTHAAHIEAMLDWARLEPAARETAMRFAKASAEYLLAELEPEKAPLAYWPPTYGRKPLEFDPKTDGPYRKRSMIGNEPEGAVKYRGEVMLLYPADVGIAFVDYWRETKDERFLAAAKGIAGTYLKTRRADGSWPLKMKLATGEPIGENTLVPTYPLSLFEKLHEATGEAKWRAAADGCFAWLAAHPLTDWNWDGQFEDVRPEKPYKNPTKHNAVDTLIYLLKRFPGDREKLALCREILTFCEKRFVVWEAPENGEKWPAPCVLEQYSCFTPIDASAAKMIRAYVALYKAEGRTEDLAKAKALADTITRVQKPSGRIPTFWHGLNRNDAELSDERYDWLNCLAASAAALIELADAEPRVDVLCIYYPEWHVYPEGEAIFGKGRTEWDYVDSAIPRFPGHEQPLKLTDGHPDDANPKDVAKEIDYAADAGIDCFVYDWYWADGHPIQHEALERGFLKAPNRKRLKFALMWANHNRSDVFRTAPGHCNDRFWWSLKYDREEFLEAIDYCIAHYFNQPEYYRKDGRIFLSIYSARELVKGLGGPDGTKAVFAEAQARMKAAGLPELHLSAMIRDAKGAQAMSEAGFDSVSAYNITPYDFDDSQVKEETGETRQIFTHKEFADLHETFNAKIARGSPVPYIPVVARGWDPSARCKLDEPFPWRRLWYPYLGIITDLSPACFARSVAFAKRQAESDPKSPGAILINAWNEYTEGSYLMPDEKNGDAYLKALRQTLAKPEVKAVRLPMTCEWKAQKTADGLVLDSLDEPREFAWRRYAYNADAQTIRSDGRYRLSFRCRVEGGGGRAFLFVLVRPLGWNGKEKDVLTLAVDPTGGEWKTITANIDVGGEADYRLQFHYWNRIKAEITDIRLEARPSLAFVPAEPDAPRSTVAVGNVPSGAKEFDVELPRSGKGLVLNAADFGVSETKSDNTAALRAAFAAAKAQRASRLTLPRGVYRLATDAPLALDDFRDFTFDGQGSTFVSYRRQGEFLRVRRCERTRLMNFNVDWDWAREPLASLVKVVRTDAKSFDLEFVDYADFPNKSAMLTILSAYDSKTRSVGLEDGITRPIDMNVPPEKRVPRRWLKGNTVRVESAPGALAVGQLYRLQHYYYHMHGVKMEDNAHLRFEKVTIFSTPGHAFVVGGRGQHHTLFDHVNIVPPKGDPKRVITCTADHLHIAQSRGFIKLENCEFSLGADDIINMHDNTAYARKTGPHTVRALNSWVMATARKGDRIEFREDDYHPTGFTGTFVSATRVSEGRNDFDVVFKEEVPNARNEGFVLFNWAFDTHNVIVRKCKFHDNRARALLILARDVTVENNVFRHHEMGAIKIETGYTYGLWSEGYGVSNVVIRGNLFDNVNPSGSYPGHRERTIYAGVYLKNDPSTETTDCPILRDILIERNRFRDNCGVTAYLSSVRNVTFYQNLIEDPTPRRKEKPYRSQFYLTHAADVRIIDNIYRQSPNVHAPGVVWDSETCSGIVAEGNRICEGKSMRSKLR